MNTGIMAMIQGKELVVLEISICYTDCQLELVLKGLFNKTSFIVCFYNVSRINIQMLSNPMVIHGFEIVCNKQEGWDRDSNYMVHDFEDNCISFFCEKIEGYEI